MTEFKGEFIHSFIARIKSKTKFTLLTRAFLIPPTPTPRDNAYTAL